METIKNVFRKLWSVFCEDDGNGSYSRVVGFLSFLVAGGWVTHVVLHTHALPDNMGVTSVFLSAGNGPYLVNKINAGVNSVFGKTGS